MAKQEISWGRVTQIWWAFFWRNLLLTVGGVMVIGFLLGALVNVLHVPMIVMQLFPLIVGILTTIITSLLAFRMSLMKKYSDFCVTLRSSEVSVGKSVPGSAGK